MTISAEPRNWLLRQIEPPLLQQAQAKMQRVELEKGQVLLHQGDEVTSVYFPEGALIGLISGMPGGDSVQTAMVGWDGAFGVFEACGTRRSGFHAEVQVSGTAWKLPADEYRRLFHTSDGLRIGVHKYIEVLLTESRQHVACNALHNVQARLSRSILEALERSRDGRVLPVTQEAVAQMLGVQRTTVTAAMADLQAKSILRSVRGAIEVLDAAALERDACCCRETIQVARREVYESDEEVCDS
ncbi:MAG TPA: Crp/Fnr family transcriptional regulator [Phenylobacterium sp.]